MPASRKMVEPSFKMHWSEDVNKVVREDGATLTLFVGDYKGMKSSDSPPDSWASDRSNDVGVFYVTLPEGSKVKIPPSSAPDANRTLYMIEGSQGVVDGRVFEDKIYAVLDAGKELELRNDGVGKVRSSEEAEVEAYPASLYLNIVKNQSPKT